MDENCQNCNDIITKNFCTNCGQKKFKRIDKKYLWDELQYTVLHTNKGLLYSVKKVLKNPGKTAREFIDGNRVSHYKPLPLVFVLSGISTFLSYKVLGFDKIMSSYYSGKKMNSDLNTDMISFLTSYTPILMLLMVPFFAITTKIAFRKWGHNFYEHVVMNSYILSFYTLISIIFIYPIIFVSRHSAPSLVINLSQMSMLLVPFILVWFFKEFYKEKTLKTIILRILLVTLLTIIGFVLLMLIVAIIAIIIVMLKGPESLQYLKPK